jgi:predicted  nucleic acid-binding Zn-ribbon protein
MRNRMVQALVITGTALVAAGAGSAASARTQASPDVLGALLVEVSGLRAAMERMASNGPRIELALGRLQLQEQRVNTLLRLQTEVRERLALVEQEAGELAQRVEAMQTALPERADENERKALQEELVHTKRLHSVKATEVQRLRTEEVEAAQLLFAEQSRWTEINQRLEELERALTR